VGLYIYAFLYPYTPSRHAPGQLYLLYFTLLTRVGLFSFVAADFSYSGWPGRPKCVCMSVYRFAHYSWCRWRWLCLC